MIRRECALVLGILCFGARADAEAPYQDRWVWIFGWSLNRDSDVGEIRGVLESGARSGLNGAVVSLGLDTLCKKSPEYFERLGEVAADCRRLKLELIPAVFSVGYGGAALAHNPHLAAGAPVERAPFRVRGGEARLVPDPEVRIKNGDFEAHEGHRFEAFRFHDQPGEVSFADTEVAHGGKTSLRMENFTANPHGHGRVLQEVTLRPHRSYRMSLWVKTEGLEPSGAFRVQALAGKRSLAPRTFSVPSTSDWRKLTVVFNSLSFDSIRLYAGLWGGKSGKVWIDDWTLEEVGPLNVLRRPGTPVTVTSADGSSTYEEDKDYAPLEDRSYSPYRVDRDPPPLRVLPGSRIENGQQIRVSWYHPMVIHSSQVTVCMAEPELYEIWEHEARLLVERLRAKRYMLNMDEVRMGGTCRACEGRNMGELLGECITRQVEILRRHSPGAEIYVWSDMLDPHHNAHGDYYLVEGSFDRSWRHVPKDLVVAVWGGAPRRKSLEFFSTEGFRTIVACYYDADDLEDVKGWLELARPLEGVRGFLYTPWRKKYGLLPAFGKLVAGER